ncbi:MAG: hypothetical protein WA208_06750 [Thermoanaerobaculia bacterium]
MFVVLALAITTAAWAQMPPAPKGRIVVFGATSETVLQAPALAGSPEFSNSGRYWGLSGEVVAGKFSVAGRYQTGQAKTIPGGELFPPAPTFQPLTAEKGDVVDVVFGYRVASNRMIGDVDVTAGYFRLWASPKISPANWYEGPQFGLKGRRDFSNGMAVAYKVGYVPTYTVNGYVHKTLEQDDIWLFRLDGEVPVYRNFYVNGGWTHMRLEATATADNSPAIVTFGGFFVGGGYRF